MPLRRRRRKSARGFPGIVAAAALAAFTAVFFRDGGPPGFALDLARKPAAVLSRDRESARFTRCDGPVRVNCVVDGDTFWYRGTKIRIADINAPEVSEPACAREARLGEQATRRLEVLLNAGPFTLEPGGDGRDQDRYGRLLRAVTRGGESLGDALVDEGVAEEWKGYRGEWC